MVSTVVSMRINSNFIVLCWIVSHTEFAHRLLFLPFMLFLVITPETSPPKPFQQHRFIDVMNAHDEQYLWWANSKYVTLTNTQTEAFECSIASVDESVWPHVALAVYVVFVCCFFLFNFPFSLAVSVKHIVITKLIPLRSCCTRE